MSDELAPPPAPPQEGENVTVACKLPNGVHLDLRNEAGRPIARVTLKGFAFPREAGFIPDYAVAGGYALTAGVPKSFWEQWLKQNAGLDLVTKGFVFASSRYDRVRDQAKEREDLKSGLE